MQQEKIVCVISNNHPYKEKKVIQIEELQNEKLIVYPEICDVRKMIMNMFHEIGVKPTIAVETSYAEPMLAMVKAGLGITFTSRKGSRAVCKAGNVHGISVEPPLFGKFISYLIRKIVCYYNHLRIGSEVGGILRKITIALKENMKF